MVKILESGHTITVYRFYVSHVTGQSFKVTLTDQILFMFPLDPVDDARREIKI